MKRELVFKKDHISGNYKLVGGDVIDTVALVAQWVPHENSRYGPGRKFSSVREGNGCIT